MAARRISSEHGAAFAEREAIARRRAAIAIRPLLAGGDVPGPVRALLEQGWLDVLVQIQMNTHSTIMPWDTAVRVPQDLIWSVRPKATAEEKHELIERIPELIRVLRDGLVRIGSDPKWLETRLGELQRLHVLALRNVRHGADSRARNLSGGDVEEIVIDVPRKF
ncbi:MAG: DUF1631 family protein [Chromatiales bacterium]|nr:DUF1631 family protein [Chromatiales bacterium]